MKQQSKVEWIGFRDESTRQFMAKIKQRKAMASIYSIRGRDDHRVEGFEKAYPEAFKANVKMPPAGHYGDAEKEIGRVCVQLASPDFKYMNGETITLEGGMGLRP